MKSFFITLLLLSVTISFSQVTTEDTNSLENQFDKIYRTSTTYQFYKVISKDKYQRLKLNVLDSLDSSKKIISEKENLLKTERENIEKTKELLSKTQSDLDLAIHKSELVKIEINKSYIKRVKPIFKRSCFDCHGNTANYPWYYKIPGIKQLIDSDIETAKKHLDFTSDFPFKSHDTPLNDLTAISKSIKNETMPPFGYRFMHSDTKLNDKERVLIQDWIEISVEKLKLK